jgi:NAD(P)-dependent dehydrogenase (short-subunit alcohol dehydrogenase family)
MSDGTPVRSTRLVGKRAIVTGAASGNGRAIALGLARAGARVALLDRDGAGAAAAAAAIGAAGGAATAHRCDVSSPPEVEAALADALAALGGIDVLVNNAGVAGRGGGFLELTLEEFDRVMAVNLRGAFHVALVVARAMAAGGGGSIINITSNLSFVAAEGSAHYAASKGGLLLLTRGMALDLARHNIRVNALAPGLMLTEMTRTRYEGDPAWWGEREARIALGRIGQPEELVGAAVFLASDESSYVTGSSLVVDGGYTAK